MVGHGAPPPPAATAMDASSQRKVPSHYCTIEPVASPASTTAPRPNWRLQLARAVVIVVAIEVGLLLVTLPWTRLWDHSLWIADAPAAYPWLGNLLRSDYLRGGVSGLGFMNLWIAAREITGFHR